jgi:hypothetical protein
MAALIPILLQAEFWAALSQVDIGLVTLGGLLAVASVLSKVWRWGVVMRWRGISVSPAYLLESYFISIFFSTFLPSSMGGDVVRAYEAARDTGQGKESVVSVLIERGSGMLGLFAAGSLGALLMPGLPLSIIVLSHGLFIGALLAIWLLWHDFTGTFLRWVARRLPARIGPSWGKLIRLYDEFRLYRREWRLLGSVMAQTTLTLILTLVSVYCVLRAFGSHLSFAAFAPVFSIITAIDVIPFSISGLGVREGSYVVLLGLLGVSETMALGTALIVRLIVTVLALIGGIMFLRRSIRPRHSNP